MGQGYPGTVYTFERHLSIDPFLAFHQCLMLILLSALLVVHLQPAIFFSVHGSEELASFILTLVVY
jgi:hypothetical protein